jgi:hypothetical protein
LQVINLRTEPAAGIFGQYRHRPLDDTNTGDAATSGSWSDQIIVKNTATNETLVAANVPYDASLPNNGAVPATGSRGRQYSVRLPEGNRGAGPLQITVTADIFDNLFEHNAAVTAEANNVVAATFSSGLASYADLEISNLVVTPSTNVRSGSTLLISWEDSNVGSLAANSPWSHSLSVVNTTTGSVLVNTSFVRCFREAMAR